MQHYPTMLETPRLTSIFRIGSTGKPPRKSYHKHEDAELVFIDEGKGTFSVAGKDLPVAAGELILLNPNVEHEPSAAVDASLRGFSLTFTNLSLTGLASGHILPDEEYPLLNVKEHHLTMTRYLEDLVQEFEEASPGSGEVASSILTALLLKIIRFKYASKSEQPVSISEKAKKYIEQNYHIELSLNDLANHIFVSPYHLSHTFKDEVGISPIQYLIQYRVEISKKFLRTSNLTISEIAYRIGYPNPNYFNLIFKKLTGISPGKYRKQ
jgi:AraC-like DNA-binding protein